jgi:hypothetical protein
LGVPGQRRTGERGQVFGAGLMQQLARLRVKPALKLVHRPLDGIKIDLLLGESQRPVSFKAAFCCRK